jgi:predicted metal-binding protein
VEKLLTIEDITGELSLRFERMNMNSSNNREANNFEEFAFFTGQFKGKCRNCSKVRHKLFQCKNQGSHNGGNNGNSSGGNFCSYCCKPGHDRKNFSSSRRRIHNLTMSVRIKIILTDQTLPLRLKMRLIKTFGFVTVEP